MWIRHLATHGFRWWVDHCLSTVNDQLTKRLFDLCTIVPRASLYLSTMAMVAKASFSDSSEPLCTACAAPSNANGQKNVRLIASVQAQGGVLFLFPTARPSTTPTATSFLLGEESTKGSTAIGCLDNPNMLELERQLVVYSSGSKRSCQAISRLRLFSICVSHVSLLVAPFLSLFVCANLACCRKSATSPLTLSTGDLQLPEQWAWCLKHCTVHVHIW